MENTQRYLRKGPVAVLGFSISGGLSAGRFFIDRLKLLSYVANLGDTKSLVIHPTNTTHSQLTPTQQVSATLKPDFVRLSVRLEEIDDIFWDLDQALA